MERAPQRAEGGKMKLIIEQDSKAEEAEITIRCSYIDRRLQKIINCIQQHSFCLEGEKEGGIHPVPADEVYYAESVEGRTFFYTEKETYCFKKALQIFEKEVKNTPFIRISKNCIMNTEHLKCVRPFVNHRMEAILKNGEKLIITRNYVDSLRRKLEQNKNS